VVRSIPFKKLALIWVNYGSRAATYYTFHKNITIYLTQKKKSALRALAPIGQRRRGLRVRIAGNAFVSVFHFYCLLPTTNEGSFAVF
jgi:hypothetical protein